MSLVYLSSKILKRWFYVFGICLFQDTEALVLSRPKIRDLARLWWGIEAHCINPENCCSVHGKHMRGTYRHSPPRLTSVYACVVHWSGSSRLCCLNTGVGDGYHGFSHYGRVCVTGESVLCSWGRWRLVEHTYGKWYLMYCKIVARIKLCCS